MTTSLHCVAANTKTKRKKWIDATLLLGGDARSFTLTRDDNGAILCEGRLDQAVRPGQDVELPGGMWSVSIDMPPMPAPGTSRLAAAATAVAPKRLIAAPMPPIAAVTHYTTTTTTLYKDAPRFRTRNELVRIFET